MNERLGTLPYIRPRNPPTNFKKRPLTLLFIALAIGWTGWSFISNPEDWRQIGISSGYEVYLGDYWSLFTSLFVHVGVLHLFFNSYWLYILGGWVEERFGFRFYALLFLISGFCSSTLELSFCGDTGVGLSGVLYAIFGLLWGAQLFGSHATDEVMSKSRVQLFLVWLVVCIVGTVTGVMLIANVAHVTGLIVGLSTAYAMASPVRPGARFALPAIVLLTGITTIYSPWSYMWLGSRAARAQMRKQWDVAARYYTAMIVEDPQDPWPLENRGHVQFFLHHEADGRIDLAAAKRLKHAPAGRQ